MYSTILVPIDTDSEASWQRALPVAVELAGNWNARLYLMTVVPDMAYPTVAQYLPPDTNQRLIDNARTALDRLRGEAVPDGLESDTIVAQGSIYDEILRTSDELAADLIVMASHRPELKDYLIGPNAARVVRHAPISVMVVRD